MIIIERSWFEWDDKEQKEVQNYLTKCFKDSDCKGVENFLNGRPCENTWRNVEHKITKI